MRFLGGVKFLKVWSWGYEIFEGYGIFGGMEFLESMEFLGRLKKKRNHDFEDKNEFWKP